MVSIRHRIYISTYQPTHHLHCSAHNECAITYDYPLIINISSDVLLVIKIIIQIPPAPRPAGGGGGIFPWTLDTISAYSHPPVSSPGRGSCGKLGAHWSVVMSTGVSQYFPIYALYILAGVLYISPRQALLIHLASNMDMQTFCSKSGNLF